MFVSQSASNSIYTAIILCKWANVSNVSPWTPQPPGWHIVHDAAGARGLSEYSHIGRLNGRTQHSVIKICKFCVGHIIRNGARLPSRIGPGQVWSGSSLQHTRNQNIMCILYVLCVLYSNACKAPFSCVCASKLVYCAKMASTFRRWSRGRLTGATTARYRATCHVRCRL